MKSRWYFVSLTAVIGFGAAVLAPNKARAVTCCQSELSTPLSGTGSANCNMVIQPAGTVNAHETLGVTGSGQWVGRAFGDSYTAYSPGVRQFTRCTGDPGTGSTITAFGWPSTNGGQVWSRACPGTASMLWAQCQTQAADGDPNAYIVLRDGSHNRCDHLCE